MRCKIDATGEIVTGCDGSTLPAGESITIGSGPLRTECAGADDSPHYCETGASCTVTKSNAGMFTSLPGHCL